MGLELAKAWVTVGATDAQMHRDLDKTHASLKSRLGTMGGTLGKVLGGTMGKAIAAGLGLTVTGVVVAAVRKSFVAIKELEQKQLRFKGLVGGLSDAKGLLSDFKAFKGALDPAEVENFAVRLIRLGETRETIKPLIQTLGEIGQGTASSLSDVGDLFLEVKAKGKLMTKELLQFGELGIPIIAELSRQLGVADTAVIEMTKAGQIGFDEVQAAMRSLGDTSGVFGGLMEGQANSLAGSWTRAAADMKSAFGELGAALKPIFDGIGFLTAKVASGFNEMFRILHKGTRQAAADIKRLLGFKDQTAKADETEALRVKQLAAERARQTELLEALKRKDKEEEEPKADPAKRLIEEGRFGFAEFANRIQDAFLKQDDEKQDKMIALLAQANKKQDELITAVKTTSSRPMTLQ